MTDDRSLWVSISSWRLRPPPEDDVESPRDLFDRYIHEVVPQIEPYLSDKGLVSSWAVRTGPNVVTYVGVFTSEEALRDTWSWGRSTQELRDLFDTYLEFIRRDVGPLTEVFHIGSRWQFGAAPGNDD